VTDWEFADAWVATAVAIQETPCDLAAVIAAGDALNHAILLREEIEQAVSRLVGADLLWISDDGKFGLTLTGQNLLGRRQGGWFEQVDSTLELLREIPVEEVAFSLTDETVRAAYAEYRQSGDPDTRGP
jgi:hypothetical protein